MSEERQIKNKVLRDFVSDNLNSLKDEQRELEIVTDDYNHILSQLNVSQIVSSQESYQLELSQLKIDVEDFQLQDLGNGFQINNDDLSNRGEQLEITDEYESENQFTLFNKSKPVDKNDILLEHDLSESDIIPEEIEALIQNINIQNQQTNRSNQISIEEDELEL